MQIVIKSQKRKDPNGYKLHKYCKNIIYNGNGNGLKLKGNVRLIVDVNPVSLL